MSLENIDEYTAKQLMGVMALKVSTEEKRNLISKLKNDTQRDIKELIENAKREMVKLDSAEFLNELYRKKQLEKINNKLKNDQFRSGIEVTPHYDEYGEVYIREWKSVREQKRHLRERKLRIMEKIKEERMEEISRDIKYLQNKLESVETYLELFQSSERDAKALKIMQDIETQEDTTHTAPEETQEDEREIEIQEDTTHTAPEETQEEEREIEIQGDTTHTAPEETQEEESDEDDVDDFNVLSRMVGHWGCDY